MPERPAYDIPSERRAYDAGYADAKAGRNLTRTQLAQTWPNAYAKGYWQGIYDELQSNPKDPTP